MSLFGRRVAVSLVLAVFGAVSIAAAGETLYVQVAETRLRRDASFLSPSTAVLVFGESVEKLSGSAGSWFRVSRSRGAEGWVHASALTTMRLVLKAGEKDAPVPTGRAEPTLAGKGFSAETEGDFKARNPALDFATLDTLERECPSDDAVLQFAREGELR